MEVVAYIVEQLPREPQLVLLLANDRSNSFRRSMLGPAAIARCREILHHTNIDQLVEFLLRVIQSMVIAPPEPARSGTELRAYLHRWIGAALI